MRLTVVHPHALQIVRAYDGCWVCIDDVPADFERAMSSLISARPLLSSKEIQACFWADRDAVVAWTEAAEEVCSDRDRWASPVTRNPTDEFLIHVFWIRLLRQRLTAGMVDDLLIVTRSAMARDVLLVAARQAGYAAGQIGRLAFTVSRIRALLRATAKLGYQVATALVRNRFASWMLGKAHFARLQSVDVLIDTYLFSGDVAVSGEVKHRYYPGLYDWYTRRRVCAAYLPVPFRVKWRELPDLYRGYRRSETRFLPIELVTSVGDIIRSALGSVRDARRRLPPLPLCGDVDVTRLVRGHQYRAALDRFESRMVGLAPRRAALLGIRPRLVLDWFENQAYDLGLLQGVAEALPDTRVLAMRQYAFMGSDLNLYVTGREVARGWVPRTHYICGSGWKADAEKFDDVGAYRVAPALRYDWLHHVTLPEVEGDELLVLLTHSMTESLWQLRCLAEALGRCGVDFPRVRIKPHPVVTRQRLVDRLEPKYFENLQASKSVAWSELSLVDLVATARLVVAAGTGAALEVACMGLPVVLIGPRTGIGLNPLQAVDARLWSTVYSGEELAAVLAAWYPQHPIGLAERRRLAVNLRNSLFQPVTAANMEVFALEQVL